MHSSVPLGRIGHQRSKCAFRNDSRRHSLSYAISVKEKPGSQSVKYSSDSDSSSSGRIVLETPEELKSTLEHKLWVSGTTTLLAGTFVNGLAQLDGPADAAAAAVAIALAYVLSDLGTGIYHWGVDNYGDSKTPLVGSQIAAFQGHHQRPWTITEREFCNNVHKVFRPASVPAAMLFAGSFVASPALAVWSSAFLFLACMSQQFHAWSHMKRSELPDIVNILQDAGLLISRRAHGAHHRAPFEGNYCIVSGWWNPILDADGSSNSSFFRKMEQLVYKLYGVEPRCWYEPQSDWEEQAKPQ